MADSTKAMRKSIVDRDILPVSSNPAAAWRWLSTSCPMRGGESIRVYDSATEAPLAQVCLGTADDVAAAVRARPGWQALGAAGRAPYLRALEGCAGELANEISHEVGMPLKLLRRIQVDAPIAAWRAMAALADAFDFVRTIGNSRVTLAPVGVVAAITPWNYPLHQITAKLAPALLAGCTVVLKPSELAPAVTERLTAACEQAKLPPGVLNLVLGGAAVGDALVSHPEIQMVSFTGSTAVGRKVAAQAAGDMKRVSMELGGKSAAVVLPGADLAGAIKATVSSCFLNSGQTCSATTRLIVAREDYPQCRQLLAEAAAAMKLGDPADGETRIGPLLSAQQRQRVRAHIAEAEQAGFDRIAGGADAPVPATGYFVAPTIYGNVAPDSRLAQVEVFGPVLAVLCYDSVDEAIEDVAPIEGNANPAPYIGNHQRRNVMADVDKWLTGAAEVTRNDHHRVDAGRILRRLATEPSPALALARHDARLTMLCAAAAAMIAFAGIETIATSTWEKPSATWLSMPPAASPFGLLVGE